VNFKYNLKKYSVHFGTQAMLFIDGCKISDFEIFEFFFVYNKKIIKVSRDKRRLSSEIDPGVRPCGPTEPNRFFGPNRDKKI